jgi:hypothetical protein
LRAEQTRAVRQRLSETAQLKTPFAKALKLVLL